MRPDGDAPSGPQRPQPSLARLDELAATLRAAGLRVTVRDEHPAAADAPAVPAGVDLSAYRIVQEALTNTLRHAGASRVEVTVRSTTGTIELEIRDDGRGAADGGERRRARDRGHARARRHARGHARGGAAARRRRLPRPRAPAAGRTGGAAMAAAIVVGESGAPMIRVVVADDQALVLAGWLAAFLAAGRFALERRDA